MFLQCSGNCILPSLSNLQQSCLLLAVVVDCFQEYIQSATDRPTRGRLVKLGMEERSRKGKDVVLSTLPSLPPRPEEISPEAVSHAPHSGQTHPAEGSASLRVSSLTVAALTTSTTTSTNHSRMPVDAEQLASAPTTNPEYPHSSSTGCMAARCPASSSESPPAEKGQPGAVGSSRFQTITRTISGLAASSPVVKAFTQRSQGLATTPPQGSPPHDAPCNPAPDPSGASANVCEQMVATPTSPSHHRDAAGHVLLTTLPSRDQPPPRRPSRPCSSGSHGCPALFRSRLFYASHVPSSSVFRNASWRCNGGRCPPETCC